MKQDHLRLFVDKQVKERCGYSDKKDVWWARSHFQQRERWTVLAVTANEDSSTNTYVRVGRSVHHTLKRTKFSQVTWEHLRGL